MSDAQRLARHDGQNCRHAEASATTRPPSNARECVALASGHISQRMLCGIQVRQDQKHRVYIIFYNAALILNLVMDIALQGGQDASQTQT